MTSLKANRNFFYATAALVGTMVGVGVFGIPFSFSKAGFLIGFLFLIITGFLTLIVDIMFGEVILRTKERHQTVGYAGVYLGPIWKKIMFLAIILSGYAALLAYTIVAGDFLSNIFSPFLYFSSVSYSYFFAIVSSLALLFGLKIVSKMDLIMIILFVAIILIIFGFGVSKVDVENFKSVNLEYWFLPYGVLLFAFAGMSAIPLQKEILKGEEYNLKKSIFWAVILVAALYIIFALTVVGVSGDVTSPDAITGLYEFLGGKIVILGSIFGILAVSTSFLMLGEALKEVFRWDYRLKNSLAWFLTVFPPLLLFFIGLRTFIDVISLAGSLSVGLILLILVFTYSAAKSKGDRIPEYSLNIPRWFLYLLVILFAAGIGYVILIG